MSLFSVPTQPGKGPCLPQQRPNTTIRIPNIAPDGFGFKIDHVDPDLVFAEPSVTILNWTGEARTTSCFHRHERHWGHRVLVNRVHRIGLCNGTSSGIIMPPPLAKRPL